MRYADRVVDQEIAHALKSAGAVLLEGPRACGKTATGLHHSNSAVRLDVDARARELAALDPALVLDGERPRLIDEWQLEPQLWNQVRRAVDDAQAPGQFLLTGSATPADDVTRHSGAGRILRLRMRPMSLAESGHSTRRVSLSGILGGAPISGDRSPMTVPHIAERISIGGWPALQDLNAPDAQKLLRSYLDDVARVDVKLLEESGRSRDPVRLRRLIAAYARHVATSASMSTIAADTASPQSKDVNRDTAAEYVDLLARLMVVEEQPSWAPHLRSRATVRQAPIRHFVDPSLAVAAMGASADRLLSDPNTLGLLFESMVIRDLRIYAQALDGDVLHYRDSTGAEADAIVHLRDGRWAIIEVKLADSRVDAAAQALNALVARIDTDKVGKPVARIIVTGGQYAYTRPDGVIVVPLACLGP